MEFWAGVVLVAMVAAGIVYRLIHGPGERSDSGGGFFDGDGDGGGD